MLGEHIYSSPENQVSPPQRYVSKQRPKVPLEAGLGKRDQVGGKEVGVLGKSG